jgi:XisI protein
MDQTVNYADILTRIIHEEGKLQPSFQPRLKIVSSCDRETGQFLLIMVGWDKEHWRHSILFHAQLIDGKVIIEADMTEGLKPLLIEAGIREEDFLSDDERDDFFAVRAAA